MKRSHTAGLAFASLLALSAPALAQDNKAEVMHWWTSGGESAAVKVFADAYTKAGGTWVDTTIAGGVNARTAAINRTVAGDPPTAMQFNTGKQFDELVENNMLRNIDSVAKEQNLSKVVPPAIMAAVTRNGHVYAVPINIHGQNWLFWSNAALAKAGAQAPTNFTDLFVTLDKLKAAGIIPLAFSGAKTWERGLFNATLVGVGGPQMFQDFWGKRDPALVKSPAFRKVAETYRHLHDYVDQGSPGRNWNDATTMVIQGKAGMQFMGDWAKGEFTAAGQMPDKDYGCTVLGNESTGYLLGGDVFTFPKPKTPAADKAQLLLANVMLDPKTQIDFALKKGSIPVRQDVDVSSLDACARKAVAWLHDPKAQVPANELLAPPAITGAVEDVLTQFWNDQNMSVDTFITKLAAAVSQPI